MPKPLFLVLCLTQGILWGQPDWRNIRDFGAVPNDGADDSAAIQAAFDSFDARRGGAVYCPAGTYDIFSPIVVTGAAVRFVGEGGPSYNEDPPLSGCTLLARTDNMTLLKFDGGVLNHRGPVIEHVNLRDATPGGRTATLIEIRHMNRWTVRNVSVAFADTGLKVNAGHDSDASWGYVPQLICRESRVCIDQAYPEGGFLVLGGDFSTSGTGIRARGAQVRVIGAKFDCLGGSVGIVTSGQSGVVTGSLFEQCSTGIKVQNDGTRPWNGDRNRFVGNDFRGWDGGVSRGLDIGPGCDGNQVIGNTYELVSIPVEDRGSQTKRYEQGVGTSATLACGPGLAIKTITVKEGIVTSVSCGTP